MNCGNNAQGAGETVVNGGRADIVYAKVRVKIQDVVDYYGRGERDKARLRQVANSVLQRCRLAYKALDAYQKNGKRERG